MDPWEMRPERFWKLSWISSLAIFCVELWLALRLAGHYQFERRVAGYAIAPSFVGLLCIWFPEQLGSFRGYVGIGRYVDQTTPQTVLYYAGWGALILPFALWVLMSWVAAQ